MTKDEALKLALETLEVWKGYMPHLWDKTDEHTITAIKQALANEALEKKAKNARELGLNYEPEPKYVAFMDVPQRTWVGLTQEELSEIYNRTEWDTVNGWEYERAIEAKLKEKNT